MCATRRSQDGSSGRRRSILSDRVPFHEFDEFRRVATVGHRAIDIAVLPENEAPVGATEADRAPHQAIQHRLQIEGRAADDLKHVGGRGLLLPCLGKVPLRLGEFTGARFELLFQLDQ